MKRRREKVSGVVWEVREREQKKEGEAFFLQLRIACFVLTRLPLTTRLLCITRHAPGLPLATPNK